MPTALLVAISTIGVLGQPNTAPDLTFQYYSDGSVATRTDAEGLTFRYLYDELGRRTETRIELPHGDDYHATTNAIRRIAYEYTPDGNPELVTAYDSSDAVLSQNQFSYDGRGNLVKESQSHSAEVGGNTPGVEYSWAFSGNAGESGHNFDRLETITYPARPDNANRRTLTFAYGGDDDTIDSHLNRITRITDSTLSTDAATYTYMGTSRRVTAAFGNGISHTVAGGTGYTGLDRFGRLKDLHYKLISSSETVHRYQYGYDWGGNRTFSRATQSPPTGSPNHDNDRSYLYTYDGLNRLIGADLGRLNSTNDGITPDPAVALARQSVWWLDNLGNWSGLNADDGSFQRWDDTDGNAIYDDAILLIHQPTDAANRISRVDTNGSEGPAFIHDRRGNLIYDGNYVHRYDAFNRLVGVHQLGSAVLDPNSGRITDGTLGTLIATFTYDGLGRLIRYDDNVNTVTEHYYYDGVRRIQTILHPLGPLTDTTQAEYVYGPEYVDEFILQSYPVTGGNQQSLWMLQDANYNVMALTNDGGEVLEQYTWDPYGTLAIKHTMGSPAPDNRVGHQGLFYYTFGTTGLYYNRNRWYSPSLGRSTSVDPNETGQLVVNTMAMNGSALSPFAGLFDPGGHFGDGMNLYNYLRNNPISGLDALGLYEYDPFDQADDIIAQMQAEKAMAAEHAFVMSTTLAQQMAQVALEAVIMATVPGGVLMVSAYHMGHAAGDIYANGLGWGNAMELGLSTLGAVQGARQFARFVSYSSRTRMAYRGGAMSAGLRLPPLPMSGEWSGTLGKIIFRADVERVGRELRLINVALKGPAGYSGFNELLEAVKGVARAEGFRTLYIWGVRDSGHMVQLRINL